MTTIWPVNYAEQAITVERIRDRLDEIKRANTTVSLVSVSPPTQNDWEVAFVTKTGLSLPIPPGARLLWLNPMSGEVREFSTAFDDNIGSSLEGKLSTGAIYETSSPTSDIGCLRLLAVQHGNAPIRDDRHRLGMMGDQFPVDSNISALGEFFFPLNMLREHRQGLMQLWIIGNIGASSASYEPLYGERLPVAQGFANNIVGSLNTSLVLSTSIASTPANSVTDGAPALGATGINPLVSPFWYGAFFGRIHLPVLREPTLDMEQQTFHVLGYQQIASPGGDTLEIRAYRGRSNKQIHLGFAINRGTAVVGGKSDNVDMHVTVYGLYNNNHPNVGVY